MTSEYTPTTEQMRYRASLVCHQGGCRIEDQERGAEFDRFIASVKAGALREASDEYATSDREQTHGVISVLTFMCHRADRIEEGR